MLALFSKVKQDEKMPGMWKKIGKKRRRQKCGKSMARREDAVNVGRVWQEEKAPDLWKKEIIITIN